MKPDEIRVIETIMANEQLLDHESWVDEEGIKIDFLSYVVEGIDMKYLYYVILHNMKIVYAEYMGKYVPGE